MRASTFLAFSAAALVGFSFAGCNCGNNPGDQDGGVDGGNDGGPGSICLDTTAICRPDGTGGVCCSGVCRLQSDGNSRCMAAQFCKAPNDTCSTGTECCSNRCSGGKCSSTQCLDVGQGCSSGSDCCTGTCTGGTCQSLPGQSASCKVLGQACTAGSECCSTNCQGGVCVRAYSCNAINDICYGPGDCCTGLCTGTGGAPGACNFVTGGGAGSCKPGGNPCSAEGDCCTHVCLDLGTGAKVCQPVGGCQVAGDYCNTTSACCGGQPTGTVACRPDTNRCDQGTACRAPGTICGKPTMQLSDGGYAFYRLPDGGEFQVSSETNCCDGNKLPSSIEITCKVDSVGVPRCFGGGSTACPSGYTGEPGCCIATGDICQFRDQCCNNALCVPPPDGGPSRCSLSTCDPVGTNCTPGANNCCAGTQCLATSELSYACQVPVVSDGGTTLPDGGRPDAGGTCRANGSSCTRASDCCSSICNGTCQAPATCQPQNATCTVNGDCCTGLSCSIPPGATSGTCQPSTTCPGIGQACSPALACCTGLACQDSTGNPCNGTTACSCVAPIGIRLPPQE